MRLLYHILTAIQILISMLFVLTRQESKPISSLPKWQQVFINFTTWNGQYSYNKTIHSCRMGVHSVDGQIIASLVDRKTHIDLTGYSVSKKVIFNKTAVYQTNGLFDGTFQLSGSLQWDTSQKYWTYTAEVTVPVDKLFSTFKFISTSDKTSIAHDSSKTTSIVLGVVVSLAVLGIVLMGGSMFWSYRKGLLRHIPMSYRTFKNPKEERRASFDSREETVHM